MDEYEFDFVIIGGGVAGLTAAQYGARANLSVAVIEETAAGGQALNINELENYPGVYPAIAGYELSDAMQKQAVAFGARFFTGKVQSIDKLGTKFVLKTDKAQFSAAAVLVATGAKHRALGIAGEKELSGKGVSYCATCDGPFFRGKRICVVGGGDAACDEALYLSRLTDNVTLIHRRDTFRAQAAVAARIMQNPRITCMMNHAPLAINGNGKVESILLKNTVNGEQTELATDAVFVFVGMEPQTALVELAKKDENGYIITDDDMQTSIAGLFCAGDLRAKPFRQIVTAAADGAYAAHGAEKYIRALR